MNLDYERVVNRDHFFPFYVLGQDLVFRFLETYFQAQVKSGFHYWVESQIQRLFVCRLYP